MKSLKLLFIPLFVIGLFGCAPPKDYNSSVEPVQRKGLVWEWCIDGVSYVKVIGDTAITVKYDSETLLPQKCESEPRQ